MKTKIAILGHSILIGLAALTAPAQTDTNTAVNLPITLPGGLNILTNFPDTTPDLATVGISAGLITLRGDPENYVKVDYDFGTATNFLTRLQISGEIYNAPQASGIDAAALYLGYRVMAKPNYELAIQAYGRRSFSTVNDGLIKPSFSGGGQIEASWRMLSGNNAFWNAAVGMESATHNGGQAATYAKAGIKFFF